MGNTNKHTQREISKRASPEHPPFKHSPPTRRASFKSPGQDVDELSCPARKTVCSNSPCPSYFSNMHVECAARPTQSPLRAETSNARRTNRQPFSRQSAEPANPRPRRKRAFHFTPVHPRAARLKKPRAGHRRSSSARGKIGVSERTSRVRLSASTSSVQRAKSARAIRVSRSKPIPHSHISR